MATQINETVVLLLFYSHWTAVSLGYTNLLVMRGIRLLLVFGLLWGCFNPLLAQLPEDFYDTELHRMRLPLGIAFDENGQGYAWEKDGAIMVLDTSDRLLPTPLVDLREEVSSWNDHGMNGFCLDNDFLNNGYFYLYYVVDMHHYWHYGTPEYHPDTTINNKATFGRVVRYTADASTNFQQIVPDSRKVIIGETAADGIPILFPFHGIGTLLMGTDGTLLLSSGEGTGGTQIGIGNEPDDEFTPDAIAWGIITADQDLGSYRSQYLGSANGKVLRIDAETGDGISNNPYYNDAMPRSPQSRIWALGLRNPYRMVLKPQTGSHYPDDADPGTLIIGDVGEASWEEFNVCDRPGLNFGWPVYEGIGLSWKFLNRAVPANPLAPNPIDGCANDYFNFRELIAEPRQSGPYIPANPCAASQLIPMEVHPQVASLPLVLYSNARYNPPARTAIPGWDAAGKARYVFVDSTETVDFIGESFNGSSAMAGLFYESNTFPEAYNGKMFTIDYSSWIRVWELDDNNELHSVELFHDDARSIVHIAQSPHNGALYYTNTYGNLHKISYGGNPAPVARITADQNYGVGPLTVQFSAEASTDPNGTELSYEWDFGDGSTATGVTSNHVFTSTQSGPVSFTVRLTVTDADGATNTTEEIISLNNTPPQVRITSFADGDRYPLKATSLLRLAADVQDAEHTAEELMYEWYTYLHHNDHFHPEPIDYDPLTFILISPLGCEEEEYFYRVVLKVTDAAGLSTQVTQQLYPYCDAPFVEALTLSGDYAEKGIALEWTTQLESDIAYYELQRGADFFHFEALTRLSPTAMANYTWLDESPLRGANIYRIKAVTSDGAYAYSNMFNLAYPRPSDVLVFPNPTNYQLTFQLREAQSSSVQLELFHLNGQSLLETTLLATPGESWRYELLVNMLPTGVYAYRLIDGEQSFTGKVRIN